MTDIRRVGYWVSITIMILGIFAMPLGVLIGIGGFFDSLDSGNTSLFGAGIGLLVLGFIGFIAGLVMAIILKKSGNDKPVYIYVDSDKDIKSAPQEAKLAPKDVSVIMSGWKSTKDGKHFKTRDKPGLNSNGNHSSHSGSQSSSMHCSTHKTPSVKLNKIHKYIGDGVGTPLSSHDIEKRIGTTFGMSCSGVGIPPRWKVDRGHPSATKGTEAESDIVIDLEHDFDIDYDEPFGKDHTVTDMILGQMQECEDSPAYDYDEEADQDDHCIRRPGV